MSKRLVTDCLGRTRQILCVYADGSYSCPFCCAVVDAGRIGCSNPECFARGGDLPPFPKERAEKILRAERERAELVRAERAAWEAEQLREAERRGACVTCARRSMRFDERKVRFVKHRKQCPHAYAEPEPVYEYGTQQGSEGEFEKLGEADGFVAALEALSEALCWDEHPDQLVRKMSHHIALDGYYETDAPVGFPVRYVVRRKDEENG